MGKTRSKDGRSKTLPSSPSHHSLSLSSSDFEFSISLSPHKSSSTNNFCTADELFFNGQILPLHLSPRLSMVQTLSLSLSDSSSTTTSSTTTSRDSTGSSNDLFLLAESCDSSRPSSVTEEDELKRFSNASSNYHLLNSQNPQVKKTQNVFKRFSYVFRKDSNKNRSGGDQENLQLQQQQQQQGSNSVKRMSQSAKEMMRKYLKKVKPFYEKLSQTKQQQQQSRVLNARKELNRGLSLSFSENLRYPRRRSHCVSSCPSSIRSSPNRGIISTGTGNIIINNGSSSSLYSSKSSSMEELQSAIQGAIAHCKNSNKKLAS